MKILEIVEKFETIGETITEASTEEERAVITNPDATTEELVNSAINLRIHAGILVGFGDLTTEEKRTYILVAGEFAQYTFTQGLVQKSSKYMIRAQFITSLGYALVKNDAEAHEIAIELEALYATDAQAFQELYETAMADNMPEQVQATPELIEVTDQCTHSCAECPHCQHKEEREKLIDPFDVKLDWE